MPRVRAICDATLCRTMPCDLASCDTLYRGACVLAREMPGSRERRDARSGAERVRVILYNRIAERSLALGRTAVRTRSVSAGRGNVSFENFFCLHTLCLTTHPHSERGSPRPRSRHDMPKQNARHARTTWHMPPRPRPHPTPRNGQCARGTWSGRERARNRSRESPIGSCTETAGRCPVRVTHISWDQTRAWLAAGAAGKSKCGQKARKWLAL